MTLHLTPQQIDAVDWLCAHPVGYVVAPPGAGKTVTLLMTLKRLFSTGAIQQALIVAPPKVVTSAWCKELQTWPELADLTFCALQGSPNERLALLKKDYQIRIISDNLMQWLITAALQDGISLGQALVIDEITGWGEPGSQRVRQIRKYRNAGVFPEPISKRWQYSYGLTATPVSESWEGLYAHFICLDNGVRLGRRIDNYRRDYFMQHGYSEHNYVLQPGGAERIAKQIEDVVYRLPLSTTTLPPMREGYWPIAIPDHIQDAMNTLKKTYVLNWEGEQIIAANAGVLSMKLAQAACGAMYITDEDADGQEFIKLHTNKLTHIKTLYDRNAPANVIIVYQYQFELKWLRELFPDATVLTGLKGQQLSDAIRCTKGYQTGRIMLLHPKSGGHGVDGLQHSFSHMIWTAPPWSREQWIQTCGRIWRQGQKNPVRVDLLFTEDSTDYVKWDTVQGKGEFEVLFDTYLNKT